MTALFEALSRASIFGLAALAVALIAQFALNKRAPAAWRAWIWRIALVQSVFALLPIAPVRWEILAPPDAATPTAISAPRAPANEFSVADNWNSPPLELPDAAPVESAPPVFNAAPGESAPAVSVAPVPSAPPDWRALLLAIYALGIAFQFAQLVRGQRQLRRITRNCAPDENSILTARLNVLAARLHLKTAPQLLISEGGSPFLTGVWRPRIVLPRALCDAETAQLNAVLAHELAHCKRRDLVWSALMWLGQTLLWFHPISWAARRFHGLETECACDELALQLAPIAPQSYGALLLDSMNNLNFHSPLAAGTCDNLLALKTRLLRLNRAPKSPRKMAKLAFALALLLWCGAVVPLKLVARAQTAPVDSLGAPMSWPAGRITEPQYDARAVVQGVVISRTTRKPLVGVPIILIAPYQIKEKVDPTRPSILRYQGTVTDARGYYRFNTIGGGLHSLGIAGLVFNDAESSGFSAELLYEFNLKNGRLRDFKTAIDQDFARPDRTRSMIRISEVAGRGSAVVQGVAMSNLTGKPLAGVPMVLAYGKSSWQAVTDARGYFRFNARPGRYVLKAKNGAPFETFDLAKGQKREFDLTLDEVPALGVADVAVVPTQTPKHPLVGSAVVQGVVVSKRNGQPLVGVTMVLVPRYVEASASDKTAPDFEATQETLTDARGHFRFKAASGQYMLGADTISFGTPKYRNVSSQSAEFLTLKDGQKYDTKFELNKQPRRPRKAMARTDVSVGSAVIQGVVTSKQTGRPLKGVPMFLSPKSPQQKPTDKASSTLDLRANQETVTDMRGYFRFNAASGKFLLLADGQVLEAPGNVSTRAKRMTVVIGKTMTVVTAKQGQKQQLNFALDQTNRARIPTKAPTTKGTGNAVVQGVVTAQQTKKPVAGARVVLENGGTSQKSVTDARGYFRFNTKGGKQVLRVSMREPGDPADTKLVVTFELENGKKRNLNLDLSEMFNKQGMINNSAVTRALIGKIAPEIQASHWANGKAATLASLRGKVVLLAFQDFNSGDQKALNDFARSFAATARVVGVQFNTGGLHRFEPRLDVIASRFPFPIAQDKSIADGNPAGGATFLTYGFSKTGGYAVIGRDGKVIYASENLQSAVQIASR